MLARQMVAPATPAQLILQNGKYKRIHLQAPATNSALVYIGDQTGQVFVVLSTGIELQEIDPNIVWVKGNGSDVLNILAW